MGVGVGMQGLAQARAGGPRSVGRELLGFSVHTRSLSHLNLAPQIHTLGRRAWAWQTGLSYMLVKDLLSCWTIFPLPGWAPSVGCDLSVGPQGGRGCLQLVSGS